MKKVLLIAILALPFIISSCKKDTAYLPVSTSGYFILTPLSSGDGVTPAIKQSMDEEVPGFDLGELKCSREFYFLLTNGGEEPFFDVSLTSSAAAFQVSPSNIAYLPGKTTVHGGIAGGFIPIITLGVTHGKRINGVGSGQLLPMNQNSALITISGKTLQNGDTVRVTQEIEMRVFARVMDIRLFNGQTEVDLAHPDAGFFGSGPMGTTTYRVYRVTNYTFDIENSGNVMVNAATWNQGVFVDSARIEPGSRRTLTAGALDNFPAVVLDGNGTITHPERIQLFDNGQGCFIISSWVK